MFGSRQSVNPANWARFNVSSQKIRASCQSTASSASTRTPSPLKSPGSACHIRPVQVSVTTASPLIVSGANSAGGYFAELLEESSAPDDLLNAAELLDALRACLREADSANALNDGERLIVLHAARGRSERWLADELGVAASTINARKKLIYNKLRKCLSAKGFVRDSSERGANSGG